MSSKPPAKSSARKLPDAWVDPSAASSNISSTQSHTSSSTRPPEALDEVFEDVQLNDEDEFDYDNFEYQPGQPAPVWDFPEQHGQPPPSAALFNNLDAVDGKDFDALDYMNRTATTEAEQKYLWEKIQRENAAIMAKMPHSGPAMNSSASRAARSDASPSLSTSTTTSAFAGSSYSSSQTNPFKDSDLTPFKALGPPTFASDLDVDLDELRRESLETTLQKAPTSEDTAAAPPPVSKLSALTPAERLQIRDLIQTAQPSNQKQKYFAVFDVIAEVSMDPFDRLARRSMYCDVNKAIEAWTLFFTGEQAWVHLDAWFMYLATEYTLSQIPRDLWEHLYVFRNDILPDFSNYRLSNWPLDIDRFVRFAKQQSTSNDILELSRFDLANKPTSTADDMATGLSARNGRSLAGENGQTKSGHTSPRESKSRPSSPTDAWGHSPPPLLSALNQANNEAKLNPKGRIPIKSFLASPRPAPTSLTNQARKKPTLKSFQPYDSHLRSGGDDDAIEEDGEIKPAPLTRVRVDGAEEADFLTGSGVDSAFFGGTSAISFEPILSSLSSSSNSYASKQPKIAEGYVGLSNQGATCYLNSLLQSLYMTPEFRSTLYEWEYAGETADGKEEECITLQLQRLFARLQLSKRRSVETKDLTVSFGWKSADSFQQHDVQELLRKLFDAFEQELSADMYKRLVTDAYEGFFKEYVLCKSCGGESFKTEKFLDVSLVIREVASLQEALRKYLAVDLLDGDNAYNCSKCHTKSAAEKGTKFVTLPAIMTLAFKRFDFDLQLLKRVKLNHRVSFPFFLDMQPYLSPAAPNSPSIPPLEPAESAGAPAESTTHAVPMAADTEERVGVSVPPAVTVASAVVTEDVAANTKSHEETPMDDNVSSGSSSYAEHGQDDDDIHLEFSASEGSELQPLRRRTNQNGTETKAAAKVDEPDTFDPNSPHLYELFSVLIHSGGALGGHYYAFIKSSWTGQWFRFDDSSVTLATEEEVKDKGYGSSEVDSMGNPRFTSNAYMLMYRKVSRTLATADSVADGTSEANTAVSEAKMTTPAPSAVPERLAKSFEAEEAEYQRQNDPQFVNVEIRGPRPYSSTRTDTTTTTTTDASALDPLAPAPSSTAENSAPAASLPVDDESEMNDVDRVGPVLRTMRCNRDTTFETFENEMFTEFESMLRGFGVTQRDCARLRQVETYRNRLARIMSPQSRLRDLSYLGTVPLGWEIRKPHQQWADYSPSDITVWVKVVDSATKTYGAPFLIKLDSYATCSDLKVRICSRTEIPLQELSCFAVVEYGSTKRLVALNSDYMSLSLLSVGHGQQILVERRAVVMGPSLVQELFDQERNYITVKFNVPVDDGVLARYDQTVRVDQTQPLSVLKAEIAKKTNMAPEQFRLFRAPDWITSITDEFQNMKTQISFCVSNSDHHILVKKGAPLNHGEHAYKFVLYDLSPDKPRFKDLFELNLHENSPLSDVRDLVVREMKSQHGIDLDPTHVRLREYDGGKVKKFYRMDSTVREWVTRYWPREKKIAVQDAGYKVDGEAERTILPLVQRWQSSTWELGPQIEIPVIENTSTEEFALLVSSLLSIPVENISAYKPWTSVPLDVSKLDTVEWRKLPKPDCSWETVNTYPWYLSTAEVLIVRDMTEPVKQITENERKALRGEGDGDLDFGWSAASSFSSWKPEEKGLNIKTKRKDAPSAAASEETASPITSTTTGTTSSSVSSSHPPSSSSSSSSSVSSSRVSASFDSSSTPPKYSKTKSHESSTSNPFDDELEDSEEPPPLIDADPLDEELRAPPATLSPSVDFYDDDDEALRAAMEASKRDYELQTAKAAQGKSTTEPIPADDAASNGNGTTNTNQPMDDDAID